MDYIRDHALNVEDSHFYQHAFAELVNTEVKMTPILHKVLKYREEAMKLRIEMAALCVPMLINYKETLEERSTSSVTMCEQLEEMEKQVNDTSYETLLSFNKATTVEDKNQ